MLSGGRIDPETELFLVWELPLARVMQYQHCALRASQVWTVKPGPAAASSYDRLAAHAATLEDPSDDAPQF